MGRKTWESLPKKPLPGRLNIVVSQTITGIVPAAEAAPAAIVTPSLHAAIQYCAGTERIFICGGEAIYRQALSIANKIELTIIRGQYEGDAFFPEIDAACWKQIDALNFDAYSFITYLKHPPPH